MIGERVFWMGNPLDGTVQFGGTTTENITVHPTGARVPTYRRWRVEEVVVCNMTPLEGFFSIAFIAAQAEAAASTFQPWPGETDIDLAISVLPMSVAGGPGNVGDVGWPLGHYLAFSQAVPPLNTVTMPIIGYGLGDMGLWVGAYPGANEFLGSGGISMSIAGRELSG